KAVIHRLPHIPRFWHYDPPCEKGYEFFLLQRRGGGSSAAVIRQWKFPPEAVPDTVRYGGYGPKFEPVQGKLHYELRTATVTITGLKNPFEERIDLSLENGGVGELGPASTTTKNPGILPEQVISIANREMIELGYDLTEMYPTIDEN